MFSLGPFCCNILKLKNILKTNAWRASTLNPPDCWLASLASESFPQNDLKVFNMHKDEILQKIDNSSKFGLRFQNCNFQMGHKAEFTPIPAGLQAFQPNGLRKKSQLIWMSTKNVADRHGRTFLSIITMSVFPDSVGAK